MTRRPSHFGLFPSGHRPKVLENAGIDIEGVGVDQAKRRAGGPPVAAAAVALVDVVAIPARRPAARAGDRAFSHANPGPGRRLGGDSRPGPRTQKALEAASSPSAAMRSCAAISGTSSSSTSFWPRLGSWPRREPQSRARCLAGAVPSSAGSRDRPGSWHRGGRPARARRLWPLRAHWPASWRQHPPRTTPIRRRRQPPGR